MKPNPVSIYKPASPTDDREKIMSHPRTRRTAGFSLIDIMIGMTIGLITVLVVVEVLQTAEARRRTSTSGADAVTNAALGLYTIERDGKNAGYGMTTVRASIGCEIRAVKSGVSLKWWLTPVSISDSAGGAPDSIGFLSSKTRSAALPTRILLNHASTDASFFVQSDLGVRDGDMMLAVPAAPAAGSWCTVVQVAGSAAGLNNVPHASGASIWNTAGPASAMPAAGYFTGDYLINLGQPGEYIEQVYSIENNNLHLVESVLKAATSEKQDLYPGIVQLQAVYGKDTSAPPDGVVDTWDAIAPVDAAGWQQILAIRVALVARSQKREPEMVTLDGNFAGTACASPAPPPAAVCWRPDPDGNAMAIDVNIGNTMPEWRHYRYHVVETTIPVRNTIWQQ
ncbi:MAG: hypothetical protein JWQ23_1909 [Herminiimonas sp.]|nr:hypothetical protein [Herminiimonas sp.]